MFSTHLQIIHINWEGGGDMNTGRVILAYIKKAKARQVSKQEDTDHKYKKIPKGLH